MRMSEKCRNNKKTKHNNNSDNPLASRRTDRGNNPTEVGFTEDQQAAEFNPRKKYLSLNHRY